MNMLFSFSQSNLLAILDLLMVVFGIGMVIWILVEIRAAFLSVMTTFMGLFFVAIVLLELPLAKSLSLFFFPFFMVFMCIGYQREIRALVVSWSLNFMSKEKNGHANVIDSLIRVLAELGEKGRGAIVVLPREINVSSLVEGGTILDATYSASLLHTIFDMDTPLHDGAVIISGAKIVQAGCILPLAKDSEHIKGFGTRHRAALGLAEHSDAIILVVSEETGMLSVFHHDEIVSVYTAEEMIRRVTQLMEATQV